jgi:hypothetical protein
MDLKRLRIDFSNQRRQPNQGEARRFRHRSGRIAEPIQQRQQHTPNGRELFVFGQFVAGEHPHAGVGVVQLFDEQLQEGGDRVLDGTHRGQRSHRTANLDDLLPAWSDGAGKQGEQGVDDVGAPTHLGTETGQQVDGFPPPSPFGAAQPAE